MEINDVARNIIENVFDGVYIIDTDGKITFWNEAAEKITGFKSDEVLGKKCSDGILVHVDEGGCCLCELDCPLKNAAGGGASCEGEVYLRHREGYRVPVVVRARPLAGESGNVEGAVAVFKQSSAAEATEDLLEELRKLALLDPLTDLPNRRYLERSIESSLGEMKRYDIPFGILFFDIDNFKAVNDNYGHETGDGVLRTVASTLAHNARSSDTVGRWGGEEFVAVIESVTEIELKMVAEKFRVLVEQSVFRSPHGAIGVTVSIGAALAGNTDSAEDIIARADALMYRSKAAGKNRTTITMQ